MRGATKAMGAMNKQMNLPALTKIMRDFERQNEKMEMTSEMMGDAVDDAFEVHITQLTLSTWALCASSTRALCARGLEPDCFAAHQGRMMGVSTWQNSSTTVALRLEPPPCSSLMLAAPGAHFPSSLYVKAVGEPACFFAASPTSKAPMYPCSPPCTKAPLPFCVYDIIIIRATVFSTQSAVAADAQRRSVLNTISRQQQSCRFGYHQKFLQMHSMGGLGVAGRGRGGAVGGPRE